MTRTPFMLTRSSLRHRAQLQRAAPCWRLGKTDTEDIALPSMFLAYGSDGAWVRGKVAQECVNTLCRERGLLTGQWV